MTTLPADHHVGAAHDHGHAHEIGFVRKYIFSMDHKVIGIQFLILSLLLMVVGGLLALAVRWQVAWPFDASQPVPIISSLYFNATAQNASMPGNFYNMLFTMHATFMIFFVIIPLLMGAFGNFLIPLQIGARDMAFPTLNMLSFWVGCGASIIMMASFFIDVNGRLTFAETAQGGWTGYPTLSTAPFSPGWGQSLWLLSLVAVGTSSLMGAVNYLTTILNLRAPGMTLFRMPLTTWAMFINSILILMSTPVLASALIMLILDRHLGTNFFTISSDVRAGVAGSALDSGQPLLYQHLFWFYSHPAVYIMILPAMGITSDVISTFSRKPIFGYKPMVFSLGGIAFLGFIVWGHHMFASGMNPILGTTFMASTIMIALPSAIKTFNWLGTMWGGQLRFSPAMLFALGFVSMFVIGGLSGIFMACAPVDLYFHDTYFIVGHIHYVLFGGALFGIMAGIYYWYPKMFGRNLNQGLGVLHFWMTLIAFNLTFFLMHIIGIGGHPRRYATILEYPSLEFLQPLNIVMTIGALMLGMAQIPFVINFFSSMFRYGNRFIIYPAILFVAELIGRAMGGQGPVGAIAGYDAIPVLGRFGLFGLLVALLAVVDALIQSVIGSRDDDRRPVAAWLGTLTWIIALPLFFFPMFGKGDFWEWIGVNSNQYVMTPENYRSAPLQPFPAAVDASRTETVEWVQRVDGDQTAPAEMPVVTAVMADYARIYSAVSSVGLSLEGTAIPAAFEETHDEYGMFALDVATLEGLSPELKSAVQSGVLMVPGWRAAIQRLDLIGNHNVSRSWKSAQTGAFHIVEWTNVRLGWIVSGLTGIFGLAYVLKSAGRRERLAFGAGVGSNPWRANSLEWYATSPPWFENFPETPHVYRGPYEYSSPVVEEDYLPQTRKLPKGVVEPSGH